MHLSTTPDLAQRYTPVPETYDTLCGLIASYCLVEKWAGWDELAEMPATGSIPKQLDEILLEKLKPPYWTKLEGLPNMLTQAKKTVASLVAPPSTREQPHILPHLKHLRDLAMGEAKTSADAVVDNFRVASMHLSYILSLPASHQSGAVLPDLPKDWSQLTSQATPWTQAELQTISLFIQSANASTAKIRMILHLALMVSPIYLLVPYALRKSKSFTRETLFKLAAALGNQKPQLLRSFEGEIWSVLMDVVLHDANLEKALLKLVLSSTWTAMEELLPSDPAATFFCRLRTTMVPMPTLPMLPAPASSAPAFFTVPLPFVAPVPLPPAVPSFSIPSFNLTSSSVPFSIPTLSISLPPPAPSSVPSLRTIGAPEPSLPAEPALSISSSNPTSSSAASMPSISVPSSAPLTPSSLAWTSSFIPRLASPSSISLTSSGPPLAILTPPPGQANTRPDFPVPEPAPGILAGPLPSSSPAVGSTSPADPSFGKLDDPEDDSDYSSPSPRNYGHMDDVESNTGHLTSGNPDVDDIDVDEHSPANLGQMDNIEGNPREDEGILNGDDADGCSPANFDDKGKLGEDDADADEADADTEEDDVDKDEDDADADKDGVDTDEDDADADKDGVDTDEDDADADKDGVDTDEDDADADKGGVDTDEDDVDVDGDVTSVIEPGDKDGVDTDEDDVDVDGDVVTTVIESSDKEDLDADEDDVDAAGDNVTKVIEPSGKDATRSSSRLEKLKAAQEKLKLNATREKPAPAPPLNRKKGNGPKKPKTINSEEIVESDVEDGDTSKQTGDKRGRHDKDKGVDPQNAPKRPRLDNVQDDGYSTDEDDDVDEFGNKLPMWRLVEEVVFADPIPITLDIDKIPKKHTAAKAVHAFGPVDPTPVIFKPVVQDRETLRTIVSLTNAVQASYVKGLPLHLADPPRSVIKIIPNAEYAQMSDSEVQNILREKHIVVTGIPHQENTFKEALRDTASLGSIVSIQDQSQPVGEDPNDRVYKGTLQMVVECSKNAKGKILNALDIPQPYGSRVRTPFTSDLHALLATLHGIGWQPGTPIYTEDFRWAIASLKGAFHGLHLDSDGLGTFIKALCGSKWWILASPKPGSQTDFAKINTFLAGNFNLYKAPAGWQLEGVVLTPGMQLIMGPNAPHSVVTIEHSVFEGGHYIATSTIKDTFYSLVHGFVAGGYIGNTEHGPSRFVLRQMLAFYHEALVLGRIEKDEKAWSHVPDVLTADGRIGLMTLCSFGILCNVLDFDTYIYPKQGRHDQLSAKKAKKLHDFDFNAMTPLNRVHCMRTRALALDLVEWLSWRYDGVDWMLHFGCTLGRHAGALYAYKLIAEAQDIDGAPHCTLATLQTQLEGILSVIHDRSNLQSFIDNVIYNVLCETGIENASLSIDNLWDDLTICESCQIGEYNSPIDLMNAGISKRDTLYMNYTKDNRGTENFFDEVDGDLDQSGGSDDPMDYSESEG